MKKKPSIFSRILEFTRSYWAILLFCFSTVGGFVYTLANLPKRVEAAEKRVEAVESRQATVEQYIEATEEQKKLIQQAPPGWQWSEVAQQYVVWKDDPRLKKR